MLDGYTRRGVTTSDDTPRLNTLVILIAVVAKSMGHCLFSRRWAYGGVFSWLTTSFRWLGSPVNQLAASLWIYLVTNQIAASLLSVRLYTYHGALKIIRNILDCCLCKIFMLEGFMQPHNYTPYVQTGLIIDLCIRKLFSVVNLNFRPNS